MMRYSLSDSAKICFPRKNTCQITWAIYRFFSNHLKGFFFMVHVGTVLMNIISKVWNIHNQNACDVCMYVYISTHAHTPSYIMVSSALALQLIINKHQTCFFIINIWLQPDVFRSSPASLLTLIVSDVASPGTPYVPPTLTRILPLLALLFTDWNKHNRKTVIQRTHTLALTLLYPNNMVAFWLVFLYLLYWHELVCLDSFQLNLVYDTCPNFLM